MNTDKSRRVKRARTTVKDLHPDHHNNIHHMVDCLKDMDEHSITVRDFVTLMPELLDQNPCLTMHLPLHRIVALLRYHGVLVTSDTGSRAPSWTDWIPCGERLMNHGDDP